MSKGPSVPAFFVAGGTLRPNSPSYVKRPADDELFELALAGQFCYVLTARQLGKSSLMIRTAQRLQEQGVSTAIIDLTQIGTDVGVEQWYLGLLKHLKSQLKLSVDLEAWWAERASLGAVQRFTDFLHDVVLAEIEGPVVIFVDEIDTTLNLDFSDDFFAAIRFTYNARATDPIYNRLTFVLLGVATPADLIKDRSRTPFNIGQGIDLREFSREDAQILQQGLKAACPEQGDAIFARIFYWTNGHPYLTQKLCLAVAEMGDGRWTNERVDELVEKLFLSEGAREETNLQFVRDRISASPQQRRLLTLYRKVYEGKGIPEDERSLEQSRLKLFGLVQAEKGVLKVRNKIYRQAFDLDWIKANTPIDWTRRIAVISSLLVLLLAGIIGFSIYRQRQQMAEARAQAFVDSFQSTTSANVRITSLAGLFDLPGYEDQARRLFYEELGPADQLALFDLEDPQVVGAQLIIVVKGLYTDLENNEEDNALLTVMAQPLHELDDPMATNLAMEIKQWLQGRAYHAQGEYQQAVTAYGVAISLNDHNPGTYFDRGLAYTVLSEPGPALADFETVLSVGEGWQERVRQAVVRDEQLYAVLWNERGAYRALAALVPTPTLTSTPQLIAEFPTATMTATPTNTPTATPTALPGITSIRPKDGAVMAYVPEGEFILGSSAAGDAQADNDEKPQHTVVLDTFWIDRYEVTNARYKKFVDATNHRVPFIDAGWAAPYNWTNNTYPEGLANYPVMLVDWNDALAYCLWAGARLPTEAEWEKAARGTDGRIYPWGNDAATCEYAVIYDSIWGCGENRPWPVGSKPAGISPYGVLDMAGNVWEWTASLYQSYPYCSDDGRESLDANGRRVARGGCWDDPDVAKRVRSAYRLGIPPDSRNISLGFRCNTV